MINLCKKCGGKNLYLEPRIKGQDVLTADIVALKCKDCGSWLKWCPKDERKYYYSNKQSKDKWHKLKEWLKNQITDLRRIEIKTKIQSLRVNDAVNCFREVLSQMQELGVEDD